MLLDLYHQNSSYLSWGLSISLVLSGTPIDVDLGVMNDHYFVQDTRYNKYVE
jgi:hypothetical protein